MSDKIFFYGDGIPFEGIVNHFKNRGCYDFFYVISNSSKSPLRRHFDYLKCAFRAYFHSERGARVFIWQQYIGYYYAFLCILFGMRNRINCMAYVIYQPGNWRFLGFVKRFLFLRCINSGVFSKVFFFSRHDELWEGADKSVRFYVPFANSRSGFLVAPRSCEYFFSGGRSNRNYQIVKNVCLLLPDVEIRVIGAPSQISALDPTPSNLLAYANVFGDNFELCLRESKAVIIPLERPNVLSGQLVILQSFEMGKAVFVSNSVCIDEWMPPDQTNSFLIRFESAENLSLLLGLYSDEDYRLMGLAARQYYDRYCFSKELESEVLNFLA